MKQLIWQQIHGHYLFVSPCCIAKSQNFCMRQTQPALIDPRWDLISLSACAYSRYVAVLLGKLSPNCAIWNAKPGCKVTGKRKKSLTFCAVKYAGSGSLRETPWSGAYTLMQYTAKLNIGSQWQASAVCSGHRVRQHTSGKEQKEKTIKSVTLDSHWWVFLHAFFSFAACLFFPIYLYVVCETFTLICLHRNPSCSHARDYPGNFLGVSIIWTY